MTDKAKPKHDQFTLIKFRDALAREFEIPEEVSDPILKGMIRERERTAKLARKADEETRKEQEVFKPIKGRRAWLKAHIQIEQRRIKETQKRIERYSKELESESEKAIKQLRNVKLFSAERMRLGRTVMALNKRIEKRIRYIEEQIEKSRLRKQMEASGLPVPERLKRLKEIINEEESKENETD